MSVTEPTAAEYEVWDEFWDTDAARCCSCPSCNYYAPDYDQHKGEPCLLATLIERMIALRLDALGLRQEWSHGFAPDEPTQGHIYDEREPAEAMRLAVLRAFPEAVVLTRTLTDWRVDDQPTRHHTAADTLAAEDRVRAEDGHRGGRP